MKILKAYFLFLALWAYSTIVYAQATVAILSPMPEELSQITASMEDKQQLTIKGNDIYQGKVGNLSVVATLTGIGKVNAAMTTQFLLDHYDIDAIFVTGVANGFGKDYQIGDVVLIEQTFQHDYGFLDENSFILNAPGTMSQHGVGTSQDPIMHNLVTWPKDDDKRQFFNLVMQLSKKYQNKLTPIVLKEADYRPKIKLGVSATGDQFINQIEKQDQLKNLGANLVDMEDAAIAYVAQHNNVPILIIRSISDKTGSQSVDEFSTYMNIVAANNAKLMVHILKNNQVAQYIDALH